MDTVGSLTTPGEIIRIRRNFPTSLNQVIFPYSYLSLSDQVNLNQTDTMLRTTKEYNTGVISSRRVNPRRRTS